MIAHIGPEFDHLTRPTLSQLLDEFERETPAAWDLLCQRVVVLEDASREAPSGIEIVRLVTAALALTRIGAKP